MGIPKNYIKWVPRVSDIVDYVFPFDKESKKWFTFWLNKNSINEWDYMEEAQEWWTFVHNALEEYVIKRFIPTWKYNSRYWDIIINWIRFIEDIIQPYIDEWYDVYTEKHIVDYYNRYQGTCDLILIHEWKKDVKLWDYKTWGLAKSKFWLKDKWVVNKKKKEKVKLQLSLYALYFKYLWYNVSSISPVWLKKDAYMEIEISLCSNILIESIANNYNKHIIKSTYLPEKVFLFHNPKTMQIRINTPIEWLNYSNAEIILEENDYEGSTEIERIEKAVELQKKLLHTYNKPIKDE